MKITVEAYVRQLAVEKDDTVHVTIRIPSCESMYRDLTAVLPFEVRLNQKLQVTIDDLQAQ